MIDRPTAAELVEAVREWLDREVRPELTGRLDFHARVAVNALGIVERELALGPAHAEAVRTRASALLEHRGDPDDLEREIAAAIRSGQLDVEREDVARHVRQTVREKLQIASPDYVT